MILLQHKEYIEQWIGASHTCETPYESKNDSGTLLISTIWVISHDSLIEKGLF